MNAPISWPVVFGGGVGILSGNIEISKAILDGIDWILQVPSQSQIEDLKSERRSSVPGEKGRFPEYAFLRCDHATSWGPIRYVRC